MFKKRFISMLVLLAAVVTGAVAQTTYKVSVKEGTEDAANWQGKAGEGEYQALPLEGVAAGTAVSVKYNGTKHVKSVKAVKKEAPATGTDLSMVDCAGNARDKQWTANCYMIHTAGDYKLPLVYGNAIKNGAANTVAYNPGGSTSDTYCANFVNHAGNAINAPWITKSTSGTGVDKGMGINVTSAELLWQDAQGLITAVGIDGDYLTLTVGKDATTQEGNALVAAKNADGTIVWSWHIWVTKQTFANADLTEIAAEVTDNGSNYTYQVTPVNLGWVGEATSTTGYSTYYQWGRKDAFIPSTGTGNTNHTVYSISNSEVLGFSYTYNNNMTIVDNIQNPTVLYCTSTEAPCNTKYYNMWDALQESYVTTAVATVKTVYDPCPPGFCIPTSGLFYYIASQTIPDEWNTGRTYSGVFFPALGFRSRNDDELCDVGGGGYYLSSTPYDGTYNDGMYSNGNYISILALFSGGWSWAPISRATGLSVRAVAE